MFKRQLRQRLVAALDDQRGSLWGRTTYADYTAGREFRTLIAARTHEQFGLRCWVCGMTSSEANRMNTYLTTAHIVYPPEPWEEVIDPDDLTRSDVVLLCRPDHLDFDDRTDGMFKDVAELRTFSVDVLDRMRVGRRTGEDLPADE